MSKKYKVVVLVVPVLAFLTVAAIYLSHVNIPVLEPRGEIAYKERELIFIALGLALIVVIPVYTILFMVAWNYREGNPKPKRYRPDFDHSRVAETIWWAIPTAIIGFLAVVVWNSSHALDPYRPIASKTPAINIQVVALDWKWLFIYPQQKIATVGYFEMPVNVPVAFQITSDAPMNSFWLPQLGGQIYAMPGMSTELHLIANQAGHYSGSSANISGDGFAGMTFTADAVPRASYDAWVAKAQKTPQHLTLAAFRQLAKPSNNNPQATYAEPANNLYNWVVATFMEPAGQTQTAAEAGL